jgi:hypothetical protein
MTQVNKGSAPLKPPLQAFLFFFSSKGHARKKFKQYQILTIFTFKTLPYGNIIQAIMLPVGNV